MRKPLIRKEDVEHLQGEELVDMVFELILSSVDQYSAEDDLLGLKIAQ